MWRPRTGLRFRHLGEGLGIQVVLDGYWMLLMAIGCSTRNDEDLMNMSENSGFRCNFFFALKKLRYRHPKWNGLRWLDPSHSYGESWAAWGQESASVQNISTWSLHGLVAASWHSWTTYNVWDAHVNIETLLKLASHIWSWYPSLVISRGHMGTISPTYPLKLRDSGSAFRRMRHPLVERWRGAVPYFFPGEGALLNQQKMRT